MAKCFAAEFCQFFEVSVAFSPGGREGEGRDTKGEGCRCVVSVGELLQASLQVEVWHQVPKRAGTTSTTMEAGSGGVVGRRLGPSFHDVLLGVAYVPLWRLLMHTGNKEFQA